MTERRLRIFLILQGILCLGALLALIYVVMRPDHSTIDSIDSMRGDVARLAKRLDGLDELLLQHDREFRRLDSRSTEAPADYEALVQEVTRGAQYFEELAFHVELLLEALSGSPLGSADSGTRTTGSDPADVMDQLHVMEMMSERSREIRAERLREFEATNRRLRHRWIQSIGEDLGFSRDQSDRVLQLYDRQTTRWSELYERVSREGLSRTEAIEEMGVIREQTDRELEAILGPDLKEKFRRGERGIFPSQPHETDR